MPGGSAINGREIEIAIEQTRARLTANEVEWRALEAVMKDPLSRQATKSLETQHGLVVADATMLATASSSADKIALIRHLFAGRHDIFPARWEYRETASGNANLSDIKAKRRARRLRTGRGRESAVAGRGCRPKHDGGCPTTFHSCVA